MNNIADKTKTFYFKLKKKVFVILELIYKDYLLGKKPDGVIFIEPDYYIVGDLNEKSIVIDVGTGDNADLSQDLIKKFGLKSYGFDPTRKHQGSLKKVEEGSDGKFTIFSYALSDRSGTAEFNESADNTSGSFSSDHVNVKRDKINKYSVEMVTLGDILSKLPNAKANLAKIDVEGEEYKVINSLTKDLTDKIGQFIFEFHHHCIDRYSILDTLRSIKKMRSLGFDFYSDDGINYLFYKTNE